MLRFFIGLLFPGGVLLAAAWAIQHEPVVRDAAAPYALYFAIGALVTSALLCWYHDQSRLLSLTLSVALTAMSLQRPPGESITPMLAAMCLLPLNFALFAPWRERGVRTLGGVGMLAIVIAQAAGITWIDGATADRLGSFLGWGAAGGLSPLPPTVLLAFTVAALAILVLVVHRRSKVEQGLLWALAAMFLGVNAAFQPQTLLLYAGAAGIILVLTVLEHGDDIAYRDELTGLLGRRAFNSMMGGLGRTYAIAVCDVDHFKQFNDTYGHETGDQVLRMVSAKLSQVGGGGRVFRYGGEEFLVVFRGRSAEEAAPFAESVRRVVADTDFILRSASRPARRPLTRPPSQDGTPRKSIRITISIGLAGRSHRHSTPELVLDAADAALYQAKAAGRNCLKIADGTRQPQGSAAQAHALPGVG